ncbi:hypothetical protein B14_200102 (plasmid) [Bacillus licheniformis]|uniref:hypothetical protein n=1 Tax=Bacillus subtilis group TaxID=653685 RepID=UPI0009B7BD19|nr:MULTISPECIES: hypothetical protein [Bacillus subtilis group]ARC67313.1 hypothetical protein B14_200102 [Bacillus licheniformis]ARW46046.1 hypothetical protein S100141_04826 [Bacillus licheniformis]MCY1628316.1 hypothetical protein [Bacillus paralicheniformis]MDE1421966.1 hypothetical protein [Bacillus licheniformis]MEC0475971.1 hypothetical protein [Bacillus licheniformis]
MTCIVGLIENGITYIGADSLGSSSYAKVTRKDKKVFKMKDSENMILGFTSSYRMGQLLMYANGLIDPRDEPNINHEYLVTKFIPNVIKLFEDQGFIRNNSGEKTGGEFLVGYKDQLYKIQADFQVGQTDLNYDACGSGEDVALGSLYSTEGLNLSPEERITQALRASSKHSVGVEAPYYIINTNDNSLLKIDK